MVLCLHLNAFLLKSRLAQVLERQKFPLGLRCNNLPKLAPLPGQILLVHSSLRWGLALLLLALGERERGKVKDRNRSIRAWAYRPTILFPSLHLHCACVRREFPLPCKQYQYMNYVNEMCLSVPARQISSNSLRGIQYLPLKFKFN